MGKTYCHKNGKRIRFWMKTPKALWEHLPKYITKELTFDIPEIEFRCLACSIRLKQLFLRAIKGMVNKTILKELVNEICNEELYRTTPLPQIQEIRQMPPQHSDLLQCFLTQIFRTLNIELQLPQKTQEKHTETAQTPHPYHKLQECCSLYLKEKEEKSSMNPKTEKDRSNALSLLMEYLGGDFDMGKLNRAVMIDVRCNLLKKYPKNRKKLYPGVPLAEILKLKNIKEYISECTMTRYMEFWNGFFNWAVQADFMVKNPASGLSDRSEFCDVRELRPPFTVQELSSIFRMIGDLPNRPRFMPKLYPMRYWVNLIALYQGMRLNEICQLYIDDIVMEEGLPCIRIRPDKSRLQKVKNKSSIRTIPIHSTLLKLGFLGYCEKVRQENGRKDVGLFPPATALDGGYQRKMQQFNSLIHALPDVDKRKSIHSYRHNFDTELLNNGAQEYFILCLDGHTRNGELMSRYAKPDMHKLRETLELVTYNGFDPFLCLNQTPLADEVVVQQMKEFFLM